MGELNPDPAPCTLHPAPCTLHPTSNQLAHPTQLKGKLNLKRSHILENDQTTYTVTGDAETMKWEAS